MSITTLEFKHQPSQWCVKYAYAEVMEGVTYHRVATHSMYITSHVYNINRLLNTWRASGNDNR